MDTYLKGRRLAKVIPSVESAISSKKIDIYYSYENLIYNIKKAIIKEITNNIGENIQNIQNHHPYLFLKKFWEMGYNVHLLINKYDRVIIDSFQHSPFESIMDHFADNFEVLIKILFNL